LEGTFRGHVAQPPDEAQAKKPMPTQECYKLLLFCFALSGASFPPGRMAATSETGGRDEKMRRWVHTDHVEKNRRKQQDQNMERKSQNHRMVGVGRDRCGSSSPRHLLK